MSKLTVYISLRKSMIMNVIQPQTRVGDKGGNISRTPDIALHYSNDCK